MRINPRISVYASESDANSDAQNAHLVGCGCGYHVLKKVGCGSDIRYPLKINTPPQNPKPTTNNFNGLIQSRHLFLFSQSNGLIPIKFEDFLPMMADKLSEEGLMAKLCNGFRLLMDQRSGLITFKSLKRNSALMGLDGLSDDKLRGMMREGGMDGDGALNEMEFCVLMVRLSPKLMEEALS